MLGHSLDRLCYWIGATRDNARIGGDAAIFSLRLCKALFPKEGVRRESSVTERNGKNQVEEVNMTRVIS